MPKRNENMSPHKKLRRNAYNNIIHNNKEVERTEISINWQMDKYNIVYRYNIILFNH